MRLSRTFILGALLGASYASQPARRQDTPPGGDGAISLPPQETSTDNVEPPTQTPPPNTSSTPPGGGGDDDPTQIVTTTITNSGEVVTSQSTKSVTTTTVYVITSTAIETTTTTASNEDIATTYTTSIVTHTITGTVDKRDVLATQIPSQTTPAPVEAVPNVTPTVTADAAAQYAEIEKRLATSTKTVFVGSGGSTTTVETTTKLIIDTSTSETVTTSTLTVKLVVNAKTTTTSTVFVTKNVLAHTGPTTQEPTADPSDGNGKEKDDSKGLSTGAKAGIGVGAGVGGLLVLGAVAFFCLRRRRSPKPEHDDFMGASEVPVGGPSSSHGQSMSNRSPTVPAFVSTARTPVKKNTAEGYRGTAMGDGRAGYAKPDPYGSAYTSTSPSNTMSQATRTSPMPAGDRLPEHSTPVDMKAAANAPPRPNTAELSVDGGAAAKWQNPDATEIDSHPVTAPQHTSPVYEMSAQPYK